MAPKLLGRGTEDAPRESRERNLLPQCRAVVQRSAKREAGSWSIHMFQELSLQEYFGCSSTEHRSRHEKLPWRLFRITHRAASCCFPGNTDPGPRARGLAMENGGAGHYSRCPHRSRYLMCGSFGIQKKDLLPSYFAAAALLPADKYIIRSLPHII